MAGLRRALGADDPGDAEVQEAGAVALVDQDVGRLDVAMDDAELVGVVQGVEDMTRPLEHLGRVDGAAAFQAALQRLALDELGDHVQHALVL